MRRKKKKETEIYYLFFLNFQVVLREKSQIENSKIVFYDYYFRFRQLSIFRVRITWQEVKNYDPLGIANF